MVTKFTVNDESECLGMNNFAEWLQKEVKETFSVADPGFTKKDGPS